MSLLFATIHLDLHMRSSHFDQMNICNITMHAQKNSCFQVLLAGMSICCIRLYQACDFCIVILNNAHNRERLWDIWTAPLHLQESQHHLLQVQRLLLVVPLQKVSFHLMCILFAWYPFVCCMLWWFPCLSCMLAYTSCAQPAAHLIKISVTHLLDMVFYIIFLT